MMTCNESEPTEDELTRAEVNKAVRVCGFLSGIGWYQQPQDDREIRLIRELIATFEEFS